MAEESVGKIRLDLEVESDLSKQIKNISQGLGAGLKNSLGQAFSGIFEPFKKNTKTSLNGISQSIKSTMSEAAKTTKKQMEEMTKSASNIGQPKPDTAGAKSGYDKQTEALRKQEILIKEIKLKYEQMLSGEIRPVGLRNAEAELKRVQKEISDTEKQYNAAAEKMEGLKEKAYFDKAHFSKAGQGKSDTSSETSVNMAQAEAELDRLGMKLADADEKAQNLKNTINQFHMNPEGTAEADILRSKLEAATEKLYAMRSATSETSSGVASLASASSNTSSAVERLKSIASGLGSGIKKAGGFFAGLINKMKNAASQAGRTRNSFNSLKSSSGGLGKSIFKLGNMLKMMLTRKALQGMISGAKEGFQNLAQYSSSTNAAISSLMSAMTRLKNSFATAFSPILEVVAPILSSLINMLATAISYVSAFFAALSGKGSYTRAVGVTEDYASSLSGAAGAADSANESAKEYQKTLSGFDEINKLDSNNDSGGSGGGGGGGGGASPSEMFETVEIDNWTSGLADKIKSIASQIFEPIKAAWTDYGEEFKKSWIGAFNEIKNVVFQVGQTWLDVWTDGAGYTTVKNILLILTSIGNWIADIAIAWQGAWDSKGYVLVESIFYMLNSILSVIYSISESFRNAFNNGTGQVMLETIFQILTNISMTVGNLATQLQTAWETMGIGNSIAQGLFDIVNSILFTIQDITGATALWAQTIDFTPVLMAIDGFLLAIQPLLETIGGLLSWVYTDLLLPLASWVIEEAAPVSVDLLSEAIEFLTSVLDPVVEGIKRLWEHLEPVVTWIGETATDILSAFGMLFSDVGDVFEEKGAVIERIFESVGQVISYIWNFQLSPVLNALKLTFGVVFEYVGSCISNTIGVILDVIGGLLEALSGVVKFLTGVFTGDWELAWEGLSDIVSGVWNAIKGVINGMIGGIEAMANGVVNGINTIIRALNKLKFSIPDWVPGLGGKTLGFNIGEVSQVSIPRLATGGIIDTPTLAMVGEAGKEAVMPLENNTGWIDSLADKVSARIGTGNGITKQEYETVINMAVLRIEAALESLGFFIDSEQLAKAVRKGQAKNDRRYNTVTIT